MKEGRNQFKFYVGGFMVFPYCLMVYHVSTTLFYYFAFGEAIVHYYKTLCNVSAQEVEVCHIRENAYNDNDHGILIGVYQAASRRFIDIENEIDFINETFIYTFYRIERTFMHDILRVIGMYISLQDDLYIFSIFMMIFLIFIYQHYHEINCISALNNIITRLHRILSGTLRDYVSIDQGSTRGYSQYIPPLRSKTSKIPT